MALLSIMKGEATKSAAPGTGNPLKNPGILFWSKTNKTNLVIPNTTYIYRGFIRNGMIDNNGDPADSSGGGLSDASGYCYSYIDFFTTQSY